MAETFDIYIQPFPDRYPDLLRSAYEALIELGWRPEHTLYYEDEAPSEFAGGDLKRLLESDSAIVSFVKGDLQWLDFAASFNRPGRLEVGSDSSFFEYESPTEELRSFIRELDLPAGTSIIGDTEFRLNQSVGIYARGVWRMKDLRSSVRLRRFGFFWIDQLSDHHWRELCELDPAFSTRELTTADDTHVVLMWDNPYEGLQSSKTLLPIAKTLTHRITSRM
jgi:hypothetical protein